MTSIKKLLYGGFALQTRLDRQDEVRGTDASEGGSSGNGGTKVVPLRPTTERVPARTRSVVGRRWGLVGRRWEMVGNGGSEWVGVHSTVGTVG